MLVLDDLHWADEPSLLLLEFLARELCATSLLLVGTYRDVELGRHHPLARPLAELARDERRAGSSLRGLDRTAIGRYIEITPGSSRRRGSLAAVHEQTEGNPFFVGEVVRLLASEGRLDARTRARSSSRSRRASARSSAGGSTGSPTHANEALRAPPRSAASSTLEVLARSQPTSTRV